MDEQRRIGRRVKSLREERHLSAAALAERAGITAATLARVEDGTEEVSLDLLHRIVEPMGLTLAVFAEDAEAEAGGGA